MLYPNPEINHPSLQLRTFPYITIPPQPTLPAQSLLAPNTPLTPNTSVPGSGNYCALDDLKPQGSTCTCLDSNAVACPAPGGTDTLPPACPNNQIPFKLPIATGSWYCITIGTPGLIEPNPPAPPAGCSAACIAKPVVYLYPTEKTSVDVKVVVPGEIFISDPIYPEGGWKNVEAHPDGKLYYQGKTYHELFYESNVTKDIAMPEKGFIIDIHDLEPKLSEVITKLGLQGREREEFLEFWIPILKNQQAKYIFFSILPPDVKDSVDKLIVTPEPDTRIEIIAYFKPLQKFTSVEPLVLPDEPPVRHGFTLVEWGGTLEK